MVLASIACSGTSRGKAPGGSLAASEDAAAEKRDAALPDEGDAAGADAGDAAVTDEGDAAPAVTTQMRATIAAGLLHTCAISAERVSCWGSNQLGQLGNGSEGEERLAPVAVKRGTSEFAEVTALAAGWNHTCAVSSGSAYCWGSNEHGQLGDGSTTNSPSPAAVPKASSTVGVVTAITAGTDHTCALADGVVRCWGRNDGGQLGNGSVSSKETEPQRVESLDNVTALAAGADHTCAVSAGVVSCWGRNDVGQLGDGSKIDRKLPGPVKNLDNVTAIVAGLAHNCAISNGTLHCWGHNKYGQVGDGTTTDALVPVRLGSLVTVTALGAGTNHTCAVSKGILSCWGFNNHGQLGDGSTNDRPSPVAVKGGPNPLYGVTALAGGQLHTCAQLVSAVYCWGSNNTSQLGGGLPSDFTTPRLVGP